MLHQMLHVYVAIMTSMIMVETDSNAPCLCGDNDIDDNGGN